MTQGQAYVDGSANLTIDILQFCQHVSKALTHRRITPYPHSVPGWSFNLDGQIQRGLLEIGNATLNLYSVYVFVAGLLEIKLDTGIVKQNLTLSILRMQPARCKKYIGLSNAEIHEKLNCALTRQLTNVSQTTMILQVARRHMTTNNTAIQPFEGLGGHQFYGNILAGAARYCVCKTRPQIHKRRIIPIRLQAQTTDGTEIRVT